MPRKPLVAIGAGLAGVLVVGMVIVATAAGRAVPTEVVEVETPLDFGDGVSLRPTTVPAQGVSSREEAIEAALGRVEDTATSVEARYGLFTDVYYRPEIDGVPGDPHFQDVPAWVVSVRGGCPAPHVLTGTVPPPDPNCRWNVVVDAATGQVIEQFTSGTTPPVTIPEKSQGGR